MTSRILERDRLRGEGQAGNPGGDAHDGGKDEDGEMADCVFHDGPSVAGGAIAPPPGRSPDGRLRFNAADGKPGHMRRPLNLSATARD